MKAGGLLASTNSLSTSTTQVEKVECQTQIIKREKKYEVSREIQSALSRSGPLLGAKGALRLGMETSGLMHRKI